MKVGDRVHDLTTCRDAEVVSVNELAQTVKVKWDDDVKFNVYHKGWEAPWPQSDFEVIE